MTRDYLTAVQHSALERALVDGEDARRYFALAGSLDTVRSELSNGTPHKPASSSSVDGPDDSSTDLLPAAMLSLAVIPYLADAEPVPSVPTTVNPWTVGEDTTRPAVTRGAQLAVRWFDVSPEQVAARAGLPETDLTAQDD